MYIDDMPVAVRVGFDVSCQVQYAAGTSSRFWYDSTKATLNPDAVRYVDDLLDRTG